MFSASFSTANAHAVCGNPVCLAGLYLGGAGVCVVARESGHARGSQPGIVSRGEDDALTWQAADVEVREQIGEGEVICDAQAAPAGKKSDNAGRGDATLAVMGEAGVAVTFGQTAAIFAHDQGKVPVTGCLVGDAQGLIEKQLTRGGIEQVVATDDIGDARAGVVNDDGKLVGWRAVGLGDDEVAELAGGVDGDRAVEAIGEGEICIGYGKANSRRTRGAGGCLGGSGGGEAAAAGAGVNGSAIFGMGGGGGEFDLLARADAWVSMTGGEQLIGSLSVERKTVGLVDGTDIPIEAKPAKIFDCLLVSTGFDTRTVDILDAEEDLPVVLAGEKPVDEECACIAQMQGAGGRWGESSDALSLSLHDAYGASYGFSGQERS